MGMVVGAMFSLVFTFLKTNDRKDIRHSGEVQQILTDERAERAATQVMWRDSTDKLAGALDKLTDQIRDSKKDDD
tara:strand:+ start:4984 stop:5208 length:225 start_codon:yes stop_codon:yes gene_type:complete